MLRCARLLPLGGEQSKTRLARSVAGGVTDTRRAAGEGSAIASQKPACSLFCVVPHILKDLEARVVGGNANCVARADCGIASILLSSHPSRLT